MVALVVRYPDHEAPARMVSTVLVRSPVRVGRHPLNGLHLAHSWVSQWHGVLSFDDDQIQFLHTGRTNRTVAGGNELGHGQSAQLGRASSLKIGPMVVELELQSMESSAVRDGLTRVGKRRGRSPDEPVETDTDHGSAAVYRALAQLHPAYRAHTETWQALRRQIAETAANLGPQDRETLFTSIIDGMPDVAGNAGFAALLAEHQAGDLGTPSQVALELLRNLADVYAQPPEPPSTVPDLEDFMHQVAATLEVLGQGFIESRNTYTEVARTLGVVVTDPRNMLYKARDEQDVLRHVLRWRSPGNAEAIDELRSLTADIGLHQVAMFEAFMAGVQALLTALSPQEIEAEVRDGPFRGGSASRWKQYQVRHRDLVESQKMLNDVLFGPEFRKTYHQTVHRAREEGLFDERLSPMPGPGPVVGTQVSAEDIQSNEWSDEDPTDFGRSKK